MITSKQKFTFYFITYILLLSFIPLADARRGCCSHHGGVCGCVCCDGTALSAKCAPYYPDCNDVKRDNSEPQQQPSTPKQTENNSYYTCIRVIDGDTIVLEGNEKVRLIGVDTPETVHPNKPVEHFGKEASEFTKRMVEGKKVRLEHDWQRKDKYGRTLAYVYLEDGTFLNLEIVKQGYGFAYTKYSFKFLEEFRQAEKEARKNNRGLWNKK